jgi:hypothetical protein
MNKRGWKIRILLSTCFFLLGIFLVVYVGTLAKISPQDIQNYRDLVENVSLKKGSVAPQSTEQKRTRIQKEIVFTQASNRLLLRLKSDEAELILQNENQKAEIIEKMHGVTCLMQEELYYLLSDGREATLQENGKLLVRSVEPKEKPSWIALESVQKELVPMQIVRYLEAKDATYYYHADRLVAENVKICRFAVPGHQLIDSIANLKPMMQGTAATVEFSLEGKELNFKAHQLKAHFFVPELVHKVTSGGAR